MAETRRRGGGRAAPRREPSGFARFIRRLFVWLFALGLLAALFVALAVGFAARSLPSYAELRATQTGQPIIVRARDGSVILEQGPTYGEWLPGRQIPQVMKDAMIAVEDRRYRSHFGIDPLGLARALWLRATGENRRVQATSTITQQLARNVFLNFEPHGGPQAARGGAGDGAGGEVLQGADPRTLPQQGVFRRRSIRHRFSASRRFFSHPADRALERGRGGDHRRIGQGAEPLRAHRRCRCRGRPGATIVLRLMERAGIHLSAPDGGGGCLRDGLKQEHRSSNANALKYFSDWVLPQLELLLPETFEPIEVWTTLDRGAAERQAVKALCVDNVPAKARRARWSALDRDGAVLALVGGTDYMESNYNRATKARAPARFGVEAVRLPGRAGGGIHAGRPGGGHGRSTIAGWSPKQFGRRLCRRRSMPADAAFALFARTRWRRSSATRSGSARWRRWPAASACRPATSASKPAMVLGSSSETRLLEHDASLCGRLGGRQGGRSPIGITKVTTGGRRGHLYATTEQRASTKLVPDYVAAGITDLLQDRRQHSGTGRAAQIGRPVAGKTGTTNSNKDGWFLGFSSGVTTGVWMGRDDAQRRSAGLQGGTRSGESVRGNSCAVAVAERPVEDSSPPSIQSARMAAGAGRGAYGWGDPEEYYYHRRGRGNLIRAGLRSRAGSTNRAPGKEAAAARDLAAAGRDRLRRPRCRAATTFSPPPPVPEPQPRRHRPRGDPSPAADDRPQPARLADRVAERVGNGAKATGPSLTGTKKGGGPDLAARLSGRYSLGGKRKKSPLTATAPGCTARARRCAGPAGARRRGRSPAPASDRRFEFGDRHRSRDSSRRDNTSPRCKPLRRRIGYWD